MPKNEEGEFELILGNRQLLSVFFIVVILLGVFFTMGYIVGRNSTPVVASVPTKRPEVKPIVVESTAKQPETAKAAAKADAPPSSRQPPLVVSETPDRTRSFPVREQPVKEAAAKAVAKEAANASPATPAPGTYLQLTATTSEAANVMVDVLRKKSFDALAAEVPERRGLFRVLVGPIPAGNLNKTRSDLEGAGFAVNQAIRKTF